MSQSSVLRALSATVNADLKSFGFAEVLFDPTVENAWTKVYLGLGDHLLFFLDENMGAKESGFLYECPYIKMERCEVDPAEIESFHLILLPGIKMGRKFSDSRFPTRLIIRSMDRNRILRDLETCFRTDYMFQHWQVPSESFVVLESRQQQTIMSKKDRMNADKKMIIMQEFQLELLDGFQISGETSWNTSLTYRVTKSDSEFYDFTIHPAQPTRVLGYSFDVPCIKSLHEVADVYIKRISEDVLDYRMISPPKISLRDADSMPCASQDHAEYRIVKAHIRTGGPRHNRKASLEAGNRDIILYVIQRRYIPPMMDEFQNLVMLYYSKIEDRNSRKIAQQTLTSLCLRSSSNMMDLLVMQSRADALMLDEDSFCYFKEKGIEPRSKKYAYMFCAAIVSHLKSNGIFLDCSSKDFVSPEDLSEELEDPFACATRLENSYPEISSSEENLLISWKVRVWRYLAWCVDGGLHPSMTLTQLCEILLKNEKKLVKITQIIQTLLYFREAGEDFKQVALPLKIQDSRYMRNFLFNHNVMRKLLDNGYIKHILDMYSDMAEYPKFIVRMLTSGKDRKQWGYDLQYTVCRELAKGSVLLGPHTGQQRQESKTSTLDDLAINTILPAMIDVLQDTTTNEKIKVLVVFSLVNFTNDNPIVKNKVMSHGVIQIICQFLRSQHDDLVRHACSLLNNCTKNEQYRAQVAKYNTVESLFRLLQRSNIKPHYRSPHILIQACNVLGNLAIDGPLREAITNALGYREEMDTGLFKENRGEKFREPVSLRILTDMLVDQRLELQEARIPLRISLIYALKNLAIHSQGNKNTIGRLALRELCNIVSSMASFRSGSEQYDLMEVSFRCIYVLSFEENMCKVLKKYHIDKVLQQYHEMFPQITRQIQLKLQKY